MKLLGRVPFHLLILTLALLASAGCSSFHRDWRAAAQTPAPSEDITGRWQGRWHSEPPGHSGRLRCLISKDSGGRYQARFHANYRFILSFGYTVALEVIRTDEGTGFKGEADLGRLAGGVYQYEGRATPTSFFSTYRAARDHGTFEMRRP